MTEKEGKIFDPHEVEWVRSRQLPQAEKALSAVIKEINESPNGFYTMEGQPDEGKTKRRIDMEVVHMMCGGILSMNDIVRALTIIPLKIDKK